MVEAAECSKLVTEAVDSLGEPNQLILLRHYYYRQSTAAIAEQELIALAESIQEQ